MRFQLGHPTDPDLRAEYGFDPAPPVQWFVDVFHGDDILSAYDATSGGYDHEKPLLGALRYLELYGFFTVAQLEAALTALASSSPGRLSRAVRRVAAVVQNFKRAAD